jgi:hypothetical protein
MKKATMMKMRLRMWTKMTSSLTHRLKIVLSLSLALAAGGILLATASPTAFAQQHEPQERIAEGKVVNKSGATIGGAVVYLKDSHTNSVKTYIADDSGHFRFGGLSQDTDYELWAESNGVRSKSREISSFDNQNNLNFTLKVYATK